MKIYVCSGLVMIMSYQLYFKIWALFIPTLCEWSCAFCLFLLKLYFDVYFPPKGGKAQGKTATCTAIHIICISTYWLVR